MSKDFPNPPTLYKKSSTGKISEWNIYVEEQCNGFATINTIHGYMDGKKQHDEKLIEVGKNIGKENATTPLEQARSEADSKWKKQLDKGYVESLEDVDKIIYLPMLAHSYDKRGKDIKYPCIAQRKFDGCLDYDSVVILKSQGAIKIGDIVEKNKDGLIQTFNVKTNKIEYKKIINRFVDCYEEDESETHQWYEIEMESGRTIKLTGNHRVWIPSLKCWRKVEDLNGDEDFLIKE